ncbi:MAG: hypothetical protein K1X57_20900 [Gemmataceae bacterium]|nr:hypothetical protein [Gemmataceae bacterium]
MQVRYGGYSCVQNGVKWTTAIQTELAQNVPFNRRITVNLEGKLEGTSQADLAAKSAALQAAFLTPYLDLVLLADNGAILESLRSGGSTTGVVCIAGPDFYSADGAEFATYRSYRATFQAEYPLQAGQALIVAWTQSLTLGGGNPLIVDQLAINGPGVSVTASPQTPYTATQTGQAVGLYGYPNYPPPLFGSPRSIERIPTSPTRNGRGLVNYPIAWNYQFAAWTPLVGTPGVPP